MAIKTMKTRNMAIELLLEVLGEGQVLPAHVVTQEAAARKISVRTLTRAKAALQVQSRKVVGEWVWALPREIVSKDATKDNVVTAVTDTPGPAPAIPPAPGNPETALDGAPPGMERMEGVGETPPPVPPSVSPVSHTVEDPAIRPLVAPLRDALQRQVDQHETIPVDDVGGDFDPDANSGQPTAVEQAVLRHLDPTHPPLKFTGWLWRRLVVDAQRARDGGWLRRAVEAGWRLEDLIDRRRGRGLLVAIAGGTIIRIDNGSATVCGEDGDQWVYGRPSGST